MQFAIINVYSYVPVVSQQPQWGEVWRVQIIVDTVSNIAYFILAWTRGSTRE